MDFNNEETPKLNLKKDRKMANTNLLPIVILSIVSVVLVVFVIVMMIYKPSDSSSTKVEISLNVADIKAEDNLTCDPSEDARKDAQKVKLSYKKSEEKYYYGDESKLIDKDGNYNEPKADEKRNGVDLVIDNISKNIYVYVEYSDADSDADGRKITYNETKDGKAILSFSSYKKTSVSVFVYDNTGECKKILKHFDVELPRYNILSENKKCSSEEAKESNYCSEYVYDDFDESALDKLDEAKKNQSKFDIKSIVVVFILFIAAGVVIYIKLR